MSSNQVVALLIVMHQMMLQNATQDFNSLKSEYTLHRYVQKRSTCADNKCADYCMGTCGPNSKCVINNYAPMCVCLPGFVGNPITGCVTLQCHTNEDCPQDKICSNSNCTNPCLTACGPNTTCDVTNHVPYCVCTPGHEGNPRIGCTAVECIGNQQCPKSQACFDGACRDPCKEVCGHSTTCRVSQHYPICACKDGFTGDPHQGCTRVQKVYHVQTDKKLNWYDALANCHSRGMRLASAQDEQEYNLLVDAIKRSPNSWFWLSGSDLGKNGTYIWMSTGRHMNYTRWHRGEPDHAVLNGEVHHCVATGHGRNFTMYDALCSYQLHYVCEK